MLPSQFDSGEGECRTTQSKMAERLAMDERSYIDLDHEKTCCSAITLALFLVYICADVDAFLKELRCAFEFESE